VRSGFWWGDLRGRGKYDLFDLCVDGRIILKWICNAWVGGLGMD